MGTSSDTPTSHCILQRVKFPSLLGEINLSFAFSITGFSTFMSVKPPTQKFQRRPTTFSSARERQPKSSVPPHKTLRPQNLESTYFLAENAQPTPVRLQSWCLSLCIFEMFRGKGEMKGLRTLRHNRSHLTSISFSSTLSPCLRGT